MDVCYPIIDRNAKNTDANLAPEKWIKKRLIHLPGDTNSFQKFDGEGSISLYIVFIDWQRNQEDLQDHTGKFLGNKYHNKRIIFLQDIF